MQHTQFLQKRTPVTPRPFFNAVLNLKTGVVALLLTERLPKIAIVVRRRLVRQMR